MVTHQLQVERGTGKFAGQRSAVYHCVTQLVARQSHYASNIGPNSATVSYIRACSCCFVEKKWYKYILILAEEVKVWKIRKTTQVVKEFWRHATSQGRIFHAGKADTTLASREQCSRLQQSPRCRYWFFCCVQRSNDSNVFRWVY